MTPEQKQRLSEIRERFECASRVAEQWEQHGSTRPEYLADIDFLLSLVKSQEAGGDDLLPRREVIARIQNQIRLWNNDTVTMACADMLADLKQLPVRPANVSDQEQK